MTKYFLTIAILLLPMSVLSHEITQKEGSIISDASYVVYQGEKFFDREPSRSCRYASFYTFDGKFIEVVFLRGRRPYCKLHHRLDPSARKPQPTTYSIKYWPGRQKCSHKN